MRILWGVLVVLAVNSVSIGYASVLTMACKNANQDYELILDDESGAFTQIINNAETRLILRSLKKENGTITANGYLSGRGTDFSFIHKYSPSITFSYGNGGKRTDECRVISNVR